MSLSATVSSSATASPTISTTSSARRFGAGLLLLVLIFALGLAGCEMRTGDERPEKSAASTNASANASISETAATPAPVPGDPGEVVSRLISGVFASESAEQLAPLVDPALLPSLHKVLDAVQASKAQGDVVSLDGIQPDGVRITASVTVKTTVTQDGKTREDTATVPLELVDGHWRVTSLNF